MLHGVWNAWAGASSGAPGENIRNRFGLHRTIAALLTRLGAGGLVLAVDDLHWADPESRELVDYLVRHPPRGRVLLVVARRSRQTPTPLTAALTRGADNGAVLHVPLEPLPERSPSGRSPPTFPRTRPGSCTPPARATPSICSPSSRRTATEPRCTASPTTPAPPTRSGCRAGWHHCSWTN
ncbi:AAA family ATPase [Streptomyces mirabilis]|uniref:AAA family ATPase n=1 Tax=Streptomyces mirabilis TaxID=68239 RepID=UPI0036555268